MRTTPDGLACDEVTVPGVGPVLVRELTAAEYDEYERRCNATADGKPQYTPDRALLVQFGVLNPDGSQMYAPADYPALTRKSSRQVKPLADRISELTVGGGGDAGNG
jgi:hypothetical protein